MLGWLVVAFAEFFGFGRLLCAGADCYLDILVQYICYFVARWWDCVYV